MRFGFTQAAKAIDFFQDLNKVSITSLFVLTVAIGCGIASIYVNYTPSGDKIETCSGFSSCEDPAVDCCAANLALPWIAAIFGIIAFLMMATALGIYDFGFAQSIAGFFEDILIPVSYLKLGGNVILVAAFSFALAALIVQNQSVGNTTNDKGDLLVKGMPVNEHSTGFILSLVSVICYFLVSMLINVDSIMSMKQIFPNITS